MSTELKSDGVACPLVPSCVPYGVTSFSHFKACPPPIPRLCRDCNSPVTTDIGIFCESCVIARSQSLLQFVSSQCDSCSVRGPERSSWPRAVGAAVAVGWHLGSCLSMCSKCVGKNYSLECCGCHARGPQRAVEKSAKVAAELAGWRLSALAHDTEERFSCPTCRDIEEQSAPRRDHCRTDNHESNNRSSPCP